MHITVPLSETFASKFCFYLFACQTEDNDLLQKAVIASITNTWFSDNFRGNKS